MEVCKQIEDKGINSCLDMTEQIFAEITVTVMNTIDVLFEFIAMYMSNQLMIHTTSI